MSQNKKKTESDVSNQIMTEMETKEQKVEEKTAETSQSAKKEKARPALHSAGLTLLLRASAPARFSARTAPITVKLLKLCPTAAAWDASTIAAESIRTQYNRMPGFFRLYKRRISSSRFSEKCLSVPPG